MKKSTFLTIGILLSVTCYAQKAPRLEKLWESEAVFTTAESAIYDPTIKVIYVSNIDGEPWGADGKGSIGQLATNGKVINAHWVEGLNCPKGMGIYKGKLYVTDINNLVEIDIKLGSISNKYAVDGADGLNDVSISPNGTVYFTDSKQGKVYQLKNGIVALLKQGLGGSNGILVQGNKLAIGTWADSSLISYQLANGQVKKIASKIPQPDGVEAVGGNQYLVSTWSGIIHFVDAKGKQTELLNTMADKIGSADIDYAQELNMVLVPTFFRNTEVAYRLRR
jgi:streptogramin lyase